MHCRLCLCHLGIINEHLPSINCEGVLLLLFVCYNQSGILKLPRLNVKNLDKFPLSGTKNKVNLRLITAAGGSLTVHQLAFIF